MVVLDSVSLEAITFLMLEFSTSFYSCSTPIEESVDENKGLLDGVPASCVGALPVYSCLGAPVTGPYLAANSSISALIILPLGPVPIISAKLRPYSFANLYARGLANILPEVSVPFLLGNLMDG